MTMRFFMRLLAPVLGVLLTSVFVAQNGTLNKPSLLRLAGERPVDGRPSASEAGQDSRPDTSVSHVIAEGRVVAYPGAEVTVGTEAAGRIVRLDVQEKTVVRKGDLIAELYANDLKAESAVASARVLEAEADLRFFDRELKREENLLARRAGTHQNVDVNRRGVDAARARRAAASAEHDRIEALLAKTRIIAPIDGVITARHAHPGETVEIAARIVTITDLNRIRIEAEIDEFDTGRVVPGAGVAITCEGYPGISWKGKVEEIPDSVVARRNRPEDPGRPIDARVLAVKIAFSEHTPLKVGQRVEIELFGGEAH